MKFAKFAGLVHVVTTLLLPVALAVSFGGLGCFGSIPSSPR